MFGHNDWRIEIDPNFGDYNQIYCFKFDKELEELEIGDMGLKKIPFIPRVGETISISDSFLMTCMYIDWKKDDGRSNEERITDCFFPRREKESKKSRKKRLYDFILKNYDNNYPFAYPLKLKESSQLHKMNWYLVEIITNQLSYEVIKIDHEFDAIPHWKEKGDVPQSYVTTYIHLLGKKKEKAWG